MLAPEQIRGIADRLVSAPSVSPDVESETRCARLLESLLPAGLERGTWSAPDGRPIVWARLRGRSPRTLVLLAHYDTVSARAYGPLGDERLAFDPQRLATVLPRWAGEREDLSPTVRDDLSEEVRVPGTWRFGRGMLDMKSGIAAGLAALGALIESREPPGAGALLVITPDEEHLSLGMRAAAGELARLREREGLDYAGALNLDYGLEPALYAGVEGKLQLGCWVVGSAAHVADPSRGLDAIAIAARVVTALGAGGGMSGATGTGAIGVRTISAPSAPTPLAFHDLKQGYSIELATEALVEFTVPWSGTPLEAVLEALRSVIARDLEGVLGGASAGDRVVTLANLSDRVAATRGGADDAPATRMASDPGSAARMEADRGATIARLRAACAAARLSAPAVVLHLLPPFYPPSSPKGSRLIEVASTLAKAEGLPMRGRYPFISDASYVAWRCEGIERLERHLPALGDGYVLPVAAASALDLDVVNLGPWGRDAHALFERVHAPFAFERLPRLIERMVRDLGRE